MYYSCDRCGYTTKIKCNYNRHLIRKVPCTRNDDNTNTATVKKHTIMNDFERSFVKIDVSKTWRCVHCDKIIQTKSKRHHYEVACRGGLSIMQCKYCGYTCKSSVDKCRHQKKCKQKQDCEQINIGQQTSIVNNNNTNSNNTITINNNTTNNNTIVFGGENFSKLKNSDDPRMMQALKNLEDTIRLVYFDESLPENQTVRKVNKKSELMEFKEEHGWELERCDTGIPKLTTNLETHLDTSFVINNMDHDNNKKQLCVLKEMLYHITKTGPVSTDVVLSKYTQNQTRDNDVIKFKKEFTSWKQVFQNKYPNMPIKIFKMEASRVYKELIQPYVNYWGLQFETECGCLY